MLDLHLNHVIEGLQQAPALIHKAAEHASAVHAYATRVGHAIAGHDVVHDGSAGMAHAGGGHDASLDQLYPRQLNFNSPEDLSRLMSGQHSNELSNLNGPQPVPTPDQLMKQEHDVQFQLQSEHQVSVIDIFD